MGERTGEEGERRGEEKNGRVWDGGEGKGKRKGVRKGRRGIKEAG